ncbi:MAG: copper chaperone PCu(A)C [Hyphomonadaceae bacterium]|nr:copper chaperone PCu(A)C [Hyphomonadaceae bacterium]
MRLLIAAIVGLATASATELFASRAYAHEFAVGSILVVHPTMNPPPGGRTTTAGYMVLRNSGDAPDRLVSASSPAAARVEIHETRAGAGGMMEMRKLDTGVVVPAGGEVRFAPGGLHLMFIELNRPTPAGGSIPVTLTFERAGAVEVQAVTERPRAADDHGGHGGHAHH